MTPRQLRDAANHPWEEPRCDECKGPLLPGYRLLCNAETYCCLACAVQAAPRHPPGSTVVIPPA